MSPELEMASAALVALAEHNIPPDIQELLVHGNPNYGIAPGALSKAIRAILIVAEKRRTANETDTQDAPRHC